MWRLVPGIPRPSISCSSRGRDECTMCEHVMCLGTYSWLRDEKTCEYVKRNTLCPETSSRQARPFHSSHSTTQVFARDLPKVTTFSSPIITRPASVPVRHGDLPASRSCWLVSEPSTPPRKRSSRASVCGLTMQGTIQIRNGLVISKRRVSICAWPWPPSSTTARERFSTLRSESLVSRNPIMLSSLCAT